MAQMVSRGGPNPVMAGVVTVADLLSRAAAAPKQRPVPRTSGSVVSVNSLLRREGRAAEADAVATVPQRQVKAVSRPEVRGLARGSAVAVGTLLAAGSVFGTAVVTDAGHVTSKDAFGSGYPGEGRLDAGNNAAAPAQSPLAAPIDNGVTHPALDAGHGAPTSWVPIAFPGSALAGVASGAATQGATQGIAAPLAAPTAPAVTPQAPAKKAAPAPQQQPAPAASSNQDKGLLGGVGDAVNNVGDRAPALAPVTNLLAGGNGDNGGKSNDKGGSDSDRSSSQQSSGGGLVGGLSHAVGSLLGG